MDLAMVKQTIEYPTDEAISAMLDDYNTVFWVDWKEIEEDIVRYCEHILRTGVLSAEVVFSPAKQRGTGPGYEMYIQYRGKRIKAPLVGGSGDRRRAICSLNEVLWPEYEIRLCIDSLGSDTLAFLPLAVREWEALSRRYGTAVDKRFGKISLWPKLFGD